MSQTYTDWKELPDRAMNILEYLDINGQKTQKDLINELDIPIRTVRYAISILIKKGYVQRIPNLHDMRSVFYRIAPEIVDVNAISHYEQLVQSESH